jgi:hypothetical protein
MSGKSRPAPSQTKKPADTMRAPARQNGSLVAPAQYAIGQLHQTVGNQAVEALLRGGVGLLENGNGHVLLQREVAAALTTPAGHGAKPKPKSAPFSEGDQLALNRAIGELDKFDDADWRNPDVSGLSPENADMIWALWRARTGLHFANGMKTHSDSGQRLADLNQGRTALDHLLNAYGVVSPKKAAEYRAHVAPILTTITTWAYSDQASERAGDTDKEAADLDPEIAAKKLQLLELAQNTGKFLGALGENSSTLDQAILQKEFIRFKKPEFEDSGFQTNLEHFNHVISAINLMLTIADLKKRQKLYDEFHKQAGEGKEHSVVGAVATATEVYTLCVKLLGQTTTFLAKAVGVVAKMRGLTKEAEECFKFAEDVGNTVGTIVSVLEVTHGVLVLCDKKASGMDKADAAVDVYTGGVGLLGSFGVVSMATVAEFTIPVTVTWAEVKWLGSEGASFIAAAYQIDLNQAYQGMRADGNEVAKHLVRTRRLYELAHEKHTPEEQAGYDMAVHESLQPLQEAIYNGATNWSTSKQRAFASRYGEPGLADVVNSSMSRQATPELVMAAGAILLQAMIKCNKEYQKVLKDTFREHGLISSEGDEGKEGKEGKE